MDPSYLFIAVDGMSFGCDWREVLTQQQSLGLSSSEAWEWGLFGFLGTQACIQE